LGGKTPSPSSLKRTKDVYFRGSGFVATPVYDREQLLAGNRISGPALIEEHASTTVLWPADDLLVDQYGNLDITIGEHA
jgi:N-methylhydantoinase A